MFLPLTGLDTNQNLDGSAKKLAGNIGCETRTNTFPICSERKLIEVRRWLLSIANEHRNSTANLVNLVRDCLHEPIKHPFSALILKSLLHTAWNWTWRKAPFQLHVDAPLRQEVCIKMVCSIQRLSLYHCDHTKQLQHFVSFQYLSFEIFFHLSTTLFYFYWDNTF